MKRLQKIGFSSLALLVGAQQVLAGDSSAGMGFGIGKVDGGVQGSSDTADVAAQKLVNKFIAFLSIVAVLYCIYGGVLILTASGDDAKVKKGKTILFQSLIGLLVIFLAYSIISWLIKSIFGQTS